MRWTGRGLVLVMIGSAVAHADDDELVPLPEAPAPAESEHGSELPEGGWLELDPVFMPQRQGLGTVEERQRVNFRLGPRTTVGFEGAWWQNEDGTLPAFDVPGLGWRVGTQLVHDVGFAQLVMGVSLSDIESPFGRGRYLTTGVALRRTWKLSKWTTIWLSLGAGMQSWFGEQPPAGEYNAKTIGLTLGGTFR